jgi:hypothetical protein
MDKQVASLLTATICLAVLSLIALISCGYFASKASKLADQPTSKEEEA